MTLVVHHSGKRGVETLDIGTIDEACGGDSVVAVGGLDDVGIVRDGGDEDVVNDVAGGVIGAGEESGHAIYNERETESVPSTMDLQARVAAAAKDCSLIIMTGSFISGSAKPSLQINENRKSYLMEL